MATVDVELGKKDIVTPQTTLNPYYVNQVWTLDSTTNLPVAVQAEYTFSL